MKEQIFPILSIGIFERKNREFPFQNNSLFTRLNSKLDVEILWKEYKIKNQIDSKNISWSFPNKANF